jgi:spermidine/putrescine-binding protein
VRGVQRKSRQIRKEATYFHPYHVSVAQKEKPMSKKGFIFVSLLVCLALIAVLPLGAGGAKEGPAGGTIPKPGSSIRLLCWEGYEFPDQFKAFEKKYGVTINPTFI